ncbi:sensor histidine kinase [Rufibacter latericius]|uniref:Histidine kinase n=1 Tax=Rufibacter latericius TaxID=2487040 RepID=A0A3M9MZU5_9BACT|nr:histidine kinase [Rufibacter latericius]RNI31081.1 histidine kinase [Rufibacter latericius]
MKLKLDPKRLKLFLWIGAAYLALWLLVDLAQHPDAFGGWALNEIWRAVYIVFVNFLFFEYTLPKLSRKRIFRSILLLLGQFFFYSFGLYAWRELGIQVGIHTSFATYTSFGHGLGEQFGAGIFSIVFFGIIRHIYEYRKLREAAQLLRIEKQEAELNYLKSQTNPHFLFNTLNNIYVLARDKSDLAPESILRLSKILRFMLYEAGGAYIAIEQELKIISDYIALEQLRYDDSLHVNFNHDIEDLRQALPPLLLIPLVENAFKHGVSETRHHPFVDIHLSVKQRQLAFIVKNSSETVAQEGGVKEHIGLSNLRRQLELLYQEYDLSLKQSDDAFTATLNINLSSHV